MSYTPTQWKAGDTVTSAKLNKIEQGLAGAGVLVVNVDDETVTMDKTWQEIHDAGLTVLWNNGYLGIVYNVGIEAGTYGLMVSFFGGQGVTGTGGPVPFSTDSADGYPVLAQQPIDSGHSSHAS